MPSPTPITCTFIKLTAYSRWRSQLLPDSLTQPSGASAADSHQQSQTSAVFCSRHGMTSAAKLLELADAATQPSAASPIGAGMYLTVAQRILTHSWSLICAYRQDVIFACYSYARYCYIPCFSTNACLCAYSGTVLVTILLPCISGVWSLDTWPPPCKHPGSAL